MVIRNKLKRERMRREPKGRDVRRKSEAVIRKRKRKRTKLSTSTLKKLKQALLKHKERITGDYMTLRESHLRSSQRDSTGDLSGYSLHMADIGTDTFDRDFGLSVAANEQDFLYRIDQALKRIEEKTYGICEVCDGVIKLARLKALPWARMCIKCKEAEEKEGGSF